MSSPVGPIPQGDFLDPIKPKTTTVAWQKFFSDSSLYLQGLTNSGTTLQRPTVGLFVGRHYFDTTLGFEIHYNGTIWVKYDGTSA